MPNSLQARSTRRAISPRFAIRTFWNILSALFDDDQRLAVFDRLTVLEQDRSDGARARRGYLVHRLHGFDDEKGLALLDLLADLDEWLGARCRRSVGGADHGRSHGVLRRVDSGRGSGGGRG